MKLKKLFPKKLREIFHNYLGVNKNNQIVQFFINDGKIKTEFAITNFLSFYAPDNCEEETNFKISLQDQEGRVVSSKIIALPKFGSKVIKPESFFNCELPALGMFVVEVLSPINLTNKNKDLGTLNSHFYAFYLGDNGSMALIHPQHFLTKHRYNKVKPYYWISQYVMKTKNISRIEVYQLSVLEVWDLNSGTELLNAKNNQILEENNYMMKAKNIRKTIYDIKNIRDEVSHIKIGVKALCGDNAKPLIFIYADDGSFTATHG